MAQYKDLNEIRKLQSVGKLYLQGTLSQTAVVLFTRNMKITKAAQKKFLKTLKIDLPLTTEYID